MTVHQNRECVVVGGHPELGSIQKTSWHCVRPNHLAIFQSLKVRKGTFDQLLGRPPNTAW